MRVVMNFNNLDDATLAHTFKKYLDLSMTANPYSNVHSILEHLEVEMIKRNLLLINEMVPSVEIINDYLEC
jgi:hypothetical protein